MLTKWLTSILLILLAAAPVWPAGRPEDPAPSEGALIIFLQQDLREGISVRDFERGLTASLQQIPPNTPFTLVLFAGERIETAYRGQAGDWLTSGRSVTFIPFLNSTNPYRLLLRHLESARPSGATLHIISNGNTMDLIHPYDGYPPIRNVARYCQSNRIRLQGLLIPPPPRLAGFREDMLNAFQYFIRTAGGQATTQYISLEGILAHFLR